MSVRPDVTPTDVVRLVYEVYGLTVNDLKEFPAFEDRNFFVRCELSERDSRHKTSECYVVKISKSREKQDDSKLEHQRHIMNFLSSEYFVCPTFVKTKSGSWFYWYDQCNDPMCMWMLTYVPGDPLMNHWDRLSARDILVSLGEFVAQLHLTFQRLTQSNNVRVDVDSLDPWRIDNFLRVKDLLHEIQDVKKIGVTSAILRRFEEEVLCVVDNLSSGIIHGDIHDMNIIINEDEGKLRPIYQSNQELTSYSVKSKFGVIDFGDVSFSRYVFEVSMVIRDAITDVKSMGPVEIAGHVLGGYLKHRSLNRTEFDVLYVCIQVALCQYIILGEYEFKLQPDNEYTKLGSEDAWKQLQALQEMDKSQVLQTWSVLLSSTYNLTI
ncbi:hydroxylysine kinase-like [Ylistrum balloti]|uniref:hydroxylysine kinase-like n=1 Tax=Ylistrum balloti TaxID=509963 RepID=UPI002905A613|nr:hydroxylysine kinase-like [Ylistrum balloti]